MKFAATLAACCVSFALLGCQNDDSNAMTTASPGAVAEDCCGSCGGGCADKAAPAAMSEGSCGSSCSEKAACPMTGEVAPAAVSEKSCGSSCGASCGTTAN